MKAVQKLRYISNLSHLLVKFTSHDMFIRFHTHICHFVSQEVTFKSPYQHLELCITIVLIIQNFILNNPACESFLRSIGLKKKTDWKQRSF